MAVSRFTVLLALAVLLLLQLSCTQKVAAETIEIANWVAPYAGPKAFNANVGDTIVFNWGQQARHNVYIHPTNTCVMRNAIFVGAMSPTEYTFTEDDTFNVPPTATLYGMGKDMFFACDIGQGQHCRQGQNLIVTVFPEGVDFPEPTSTSAPTDGETVWDSTYNTDSDTGSDTGSDTSPETEPETNTGPDTDAIMGVLNPAIDSNRPPIITGIDPTPPPNTNTSSMMMDDNMTSSEMDFPDLMDDENITESNSGNETESSNDMNDDTDATTAADGTTSDESVDPTTPSINAIVDDNSSSMMNHPLPHYSITITICTVSVMVAAILLL